MNILALIGAMSSFLSLQGQVAYVDTGAGGVVTVLDLAGGAAVPVGPGQRDGAPVWSPDGAWLAFATDTGVGRGIYVVAHDGSQGRMAGLADAWNAAPAWSTDGTRIAYTSAPARGAASQLRVVDLNTGEDVLWGGGRAGLAEPQWLPYTLLVRHLNPDQRLEVPGVDMARFIQEARMRELDLLGEVPPQAVLAMQMVPTQSGDDVVLGTRIVLVTQSEVLPVMALADPEGTLEDGLSWGVTANWSEVQLTPLSDPARRYGAFELSEPGSSIRVAFESNRGGDREIYVLGKRGIANVSNHRSADWNPVWSPDGKVIAFESFRSGLRGVYRLYAETAHVLPVAVHAAANCWSPAWSPDGEHLLYISDESGADALYVVTIQNGDVVQLTRDAGGKEAPSWRPEWR